MAYYLPIATGRLFRFPWVLVLCEMQTVSISIAFIYTWYILIDVCNHVKSFILSALQERFWDFVDSWRLHCLFILLGNFILNFKCSPTSLAEGCLNVFPDVSLITFELIWVLQDRSMGVSGFCLTNTGYLWDKFLGLSLKFFAGQIGDFSEMRFIVYFCFLKEWFV